LRRSSLPLTRRIFLDALRFVKKQPPARVDLSDCRFVPSRSLAHETIIRIHARGTLDVDDLYPTNPARAVNKVYLMIDQPKPHEQEMLVALTEATGFFHSDEIEIVREMFEDWLKNPESDEYLWIVYRDSENAPPLGFAVYGPASAAIGTYDLYWIVVDKNHQDKKIGSALLNHIEQDLFNRNARQLYIETSDKAQYAPTRTFYERRGYALVAHFQDYYDVGDGKVIYFKAFRETKK
jgi:GNAT superfamily N-acetyltransferase